MSSTTSFPTFARPVRWLIWSLPALALAFAALGARAQQADPPGRVAAVTERHGSVVFAPAGEEDWSELPANRPLTQADRLWTDAGAKVELHLGAETVHVRDLTNLGIVELDDDAVHLSITQGSVNARVRQVRAGERFQIGTPNLTASASQPADWRIDVDPDTASTRVTVHSGTVTLRGGEGGRALVLGAGQDIQFVARDLEQVEPLHRAPDAFDQWASARNQTEDQSQTAKYVPREVVGYPQLDNNGVWSQSQEYGPVWYPNVSTVDWAPYRQGRWMWVQPWGWTWVDDAPWGFAPYHYGRWAMIGSRWAWVPTGIGPRPVYAPALVAFVGGGNNANFSVGSSPGIGWYPLAPGEAWRPFYRTSTVYVRNVNYNIVPRPATVYTHHRWVTAVRVDDFNHGRHVTNHWHRVDPHVAANVTTTTTLPRPNWTNWQRPPMAPTPRLVQQPPRSTVLPAAQLAVQPAAPAVQQQPRWVQRPQQTWQPRVQPQVQVQTQVQTQVQPQVQVQQPRWQPRHVPQQQPAAPAAATPVAPQPVQPVQPVRVPNQRVVPQVQAAQPMAAAPAPQAQEHNRGQHRGWQPQEQGGERGERGDRGERGGWRR